MSNSPKDKNDQLSQSDDVLRGTTLRVYRFLYRHGRPARITEIQKALQMRSPSLAEYHIKKLQAAGLIQEKEDGYMVDRILFENMVRIRGAILPLRVAYSGFFATTLLLMLTLLRPPLTPFFVFAIVVNLSALAIFVYEAVSRALENRL